MLDISLSIISKSLAVVILRSGTGGLDDSRTSSSRRSNLEGGLRSGAEESPIIYHRSRKRWKESAAKRRGRMRPRTTVHSLPLMGVEGSRGGMDRRDDFLGLPPENWLSRSMSSALRPPTLRPLVRSCSFSSSTDIPEKFSLASPLMLMTATRARCCCCGCCC
jgi:hypothetical protein